MAAAANQVATLFSGQSSDTTGDAVLLEPSQLGKTRKYDIILRGSLGGGTFTMTISHDSTDGTDGTFVAIPTFNQSQIGLINHILVEQRIYVKPVLAGSSGASLTAELFYRN